MAFHARILAFGLLVPSCFSPDAPGDTDAAGADDTSSGGGSTGNSTTPTQGSSSDATTLSATGTGDTDPTDTSPTATDPTGMDETGTDPTDTDPTGADTGGVAVCGDGEIEGAEVCDDGVNDGSYGGCESDCSGLGPFCGDGLKHGSEDCDDGDELQGNGCNNDCVPSGLELWTHEEHQTPTDECVSIVPTAAGHVYLAAHIENIDGGEYAGSFYAQRLSDSGSVDWEREHAPLATPTTHDYLTRAATNAGDGLVIAGAHRNPADQHPLLANYTDMHLVKLSAANGDVVWSRNDNAPDLPVGVVMDDDGEFAVAGITSNDFDSYIFRVSEGGDAVGGTDFTAGGGLSAIAFDPAGSFLVAMNPGDESLLQRRNAGFGVLWEADLSGMVVEMTAGQGGDIYAAGSGWIGRRMSGNGAELWTVVTGEVASLGSPESIAATPEGDIVVAGGRQGAPWLARLDPAGAVLWSRSAGEDGSFASVGVRADGSVVACGTIDGGGQGDNIFVATYTP